MIRCHSGHCTRRGELSTGFSTPCATLESVFGHELPSGDRLAIAGISGIASRHASRCKVWGEPTDAEIDVAVAELRSRGYDQRPDLLAQWAGIVLGSAEQRGYGREKAAAEAAILIAAGADESLIPRWIAVGKERAARAGKAPRQFPGHAAVRNQDPPSPGAG